MDKKEALKIVQESGSELENLPDEFKKDKEVVLAAVKQDAELPLVVMFSYVHSFRPFFFATKCDVIATGFNTL